MAHSSTFDGRGLQKCQQCEKEFSDERAQCPFCKAWQLPKDKHRAKTSAEGVGKEDDTVMLDQIPDADVKRIVSGPWDINFGGKGTKKEPFGIAQTSAILLGGEPGAGKSTIALQILNGIVASTGRAGLVVGAEESAAEVMARSARLTLSHRHMIRLLPMGSNSDLVTVMERHKPSCVVMDSLPGFTDDPAAAVQLAGALKSHAVFLNCPIMLIDHINKAQDFAGFMSLQHKVDTTMQLSTDDSDLRTLFTIKNRYGPGHVESFYEMTEQGLVHVEIEEDEDE